MISHIYPILSMRQQAAEEERSLRRRVKDTYALRLRRRHKFEKVTLLATFFRSGLLSLVLALTACGEEPRAATQTVPDNQATHVTTPNATPSDIPELTTDDVRTVAQSPTPSSIPNRLPAQTTNIPNSSPLHSPQYLLSSAPTRLMGMLSAEERQCLGPGIKTDGDLMVALSADSISPESIISDRIMQCLTNENQFQLYLASVEGEDDLSVASHRCIWDSFSDISVIIEKPEDIESFTLFSKMFLAIATGYVYCIASEQPDYEGFSEMEGVEADPEDMVCVIDAVGGMNRWLELLLSENEILLEPELELAERECGVNLNDLVNLD